MRFIDIQTECIIEKVEDFSRINGSLKKILISGVVGVVGVTATCAYLSAQKAKGFGLES